MRRPSLLELAYHAEHGGMSGPGWRIYLRDECARLKISPVAEQQIARVVWGFTGVLLVADRQYRTIWAFETDGGVHRDVRAAKGSGLLVKRGFLREYPAVHPPDLGEWLRDEVLKRSRRRT